MKRISICLGVGLLLARPEISAADSIGVEPWQVVRRVDGPMPAPLAPDVQQQIASDVGPGQFLVSDFQVADREGRHVQRLVFLFRSRAGLDDGQPFARYVVDDDSRLRCYGAEEDGAIIAALAGDKTDPAIAGAVGLGLFGGRATLLTWTKTGSDATTSTWCGCFALDKKFVEEIVVRSTENGFAIVQRDRIPRPPSLIPIVEDDRGSVVEEWTIDHTPVWHATKRYQVRLAYVALSRNPRQMYKLGVELLADPMPGASAQGWRLVKEAAAAGYGDARKLMAERLAGTMRRVSDREQADAER